MRMTGLKSIALAVGLAIAGIGTAQAAPAPQGAAPAAAQSAPAATTAAAPTDPMLAMVLQKQVSPNGREALWFHNAILFPVITAITVFVLILLIIVVARFRAAANPVPTKTAHNTLLEIAWTLIPVVILALIAAPSIGLLQAQYKPAPKNAVTLKAIGNQWYWSYEYPDHAVQLTSNMLKEKDQVSGKDRARTDADGPRLLATDQRVVLPINTPIRLITTSNDVIHSWSIPAFWVKLDAIPGRLNETSFLIEKPGVYFGVCSELCGARHGFMPITVEAVTPAVFAQWVKAKGGSMPGATPAAAAPADNGAAATNLAGPTVAATVTPPTTNQAATANPAGAGNAGN